MKTATGIVMRENANSETHLQQPWLTKPRLIWIVVVVLFMGVYALSFRVYIQQTFDNFSVNPPGKGTETAWTEAEFQAVLAQAGLGVDFFNWFTLAWSLLDLLPFWGIAWLIFLRKSEDRMAYLLAICFIITGTNPPVFRAPLEPLAQVYPAWRLISEALIIPFMVSLPLIFYLFPNGQWVPRWTRWSYWIWVVYFGLVTVGPASLRFGGEYDAIGSFIVIGLMATFPVAQIYRYLRVSGPVERQQIKWVVFGLAFGTTWVLATFLTGYIFPSLYQPRLAGLIYHLMVNYVEWAVFLLAIPVSFAIAILRSRLWDIDVVIRKTLQYSLLTGLLVLAYFGSIVLLQNLFFGEQTSEIAIVLSTLAIAALFNPLRIRIQNFIDRRFYRKKYNAEQALAEFAATARDEVDMDKLTAALMKVVEETVQPEKVTLWLVEEKQRKSVASPRIVNR